MKKINTVKAHREFDRIVHHGRALRSSHFTVFHAPSTLGYARLGISVGKKNGIAVRRVLIKRQVRAMLAKADLLRLNIDVIVAVKATYDPGHYAGNEEELLGLLATMKETIIETVQE